MDISTSGATRCGVCLTGVEAGPHIASFIDGFEANPDDSSIRWSRYCKHDCETSSGKDRLLKERANNVGTFYKKTVDERSKEHQAPSSLNHRDGANSEDLESLLFASSCLLPVQYYGRVCRSRNLGGEQKLMFAVLADALRCYLRFAKPRDVQERQELHELECWFRDNDGSGIFSFKSLCQTFGIDAKVVRTSLRVGRAGEKWGFRRSPWMD